MESSVLFGRPCSPGIAIGAFKVYSKELPLISDTKVSDTSLESKRLLTAFEQVKQDLDFLIKKHSNSGTKESIEILEAHSLMLEDPEWQDNILTLIQDGFNALYATHTASQSFIQALEALEDLYLRQRAADIRDVSSRVLSAISGQASEASLLNEPALLVAKDILPSQFLSLNLENLLGFALEGGSPTSHTSILAKTYEIPLVVGVKGLISSLDKAQNLVINGLRGSVTINPSAEELSSLQQAQAKQKAEREELNTYITKPSITLDGHAVEVASNLSSLLDLDFALKKGTEGVGLFRTEFLLFDRPQMPSENEQFSLYKTAVQKLSPHKAVIRTFDIGGDKTVPYLDLPKEDNPFLGLRGLRLCLKHPELFIPQLRALLRASAFGKLAIMAPMVTTVDEVLAFKSVLQKTGAELRAEGFSVGDYEVGIMIEVPAVALIARELSAHLDFFSVGTNDLIQYLCATDRMNEEVSHLHDPYHPGVLRFLHLIAEEVAGTKAWLGMCGELAAQPDYVPLLLALGFKELSVSPGAVLRTRKAVCSTGLETARTTMKKALSCRSSLELKTLLGLDA